MRFFSVFSGVGGFEIGIQQAYADSRMGGEGGQDIRIQQGQEKEHDPGTHLSVPERDSGQPDEGSRPQAHCVGFSEIDKYASAVLRYRFPNTINYGDITKIDWASVPDFDLLVGGSPCQDLSVAGKGAGLSGSRSGLFREYLRALEAKKPHHFVWENVKGALSSSGGRDFATILNSFSEAGYSLSWQVLNAKDCGVPQNRERVFVIGTRADLGSAREVFFEARNGEARPVEVTQNAPDAQRVYDPAGIGRTLKGLGGGQGARSMLIRCPLRFLTRNQKDIEGDYAFTVDASQTAGVTDGTRVRRLMPIECERLMSWPDNWTRFGILPSKDGRGGIQAYEMSDSQRYKMCGNGVVSKVVTEVIKAHIL